VKRALGRKRSAGARDGLTRSQAEAELRRQIEAASVSVARAERKTVEEAGALYVEHLRTIKQRKRTTLADYEGYLRRHLVPYFGGRTLDRIEPEHVEAYMHVKLAGLSSKTVTNHLTFALLRSLQRDGAPVDDKANLVLGAAAPVLAIERFDRLGQPQVLLASIHRSWGGFCLGRGVK